MTQINESSKSILAGICVSIGCICYLLIDNKILGSLLFSFGLFTVLEYNLNLFTGKVGLVKSAKDVSDCIFDFMGNIIGCTITYTLISYTSIYDKIYDNWLQLATKKYNYSMTELFVLGIFCGILILVASKHKTNQILTMLCISVFILCGFEHSIADAFYFLLVDEPIYMYFIKIIIIALGNAMGAIITNRIIDPITK